MTTFREGIFEDMSFEDYAAVDALNGSKILKMRRSPMFYRWSLDNPQMDTQAMFLGRLIHQMVLEPKTVGDFAVWGSEPHHKVRNGRAWEEFQQDNRDRQIVTKAELDAAVGTATAALSHAPIRFYANSNGPTEVSMFWVHPGDGRRYKARLDKLIPETDTIPDLKTCVDCRDFRFGPQAYRMGYVMKMGLYWDGYRILTGREPSVKLLAIEKTKPHESAVYNLPRELLVLGLEEFDALVLRLDECEKSNHWPAAQEWEQDLVLPPWATAEEDTPLELEV